MCSNEKNLYDFYRLIGSGRFASMHKGNDYFAVSGCQGSWPQMIFDIHFDQNAGLFLEKAFKEVAEVVDVGFAVCNKELFKGNDQELFRAKGIFPVGNWQLMEINSIDELKIKMPEEYKISRLNEPGQIDEFATLVNTNLMKNQLVKRELLQELAQYAGVEIFGLFRENKLVSGLLAYSGVDEVAGLYFITTKLEYRGKGLAAVIIGSTVKSLFLQGAGKVVLQAIPKAVTLYARIGFTHRGELVILWKK